MSDPARLNDEEREELVAFLDGELTDDDAHKVEAKLNVDPRTRAEADALRKTWDLLDFLPSPEPSPNFTNRTLERLNPIRKTQAMRRRTLRIAVVALAWAAALLLALAAGYVGTTLALKVRHSNDDMARDLRVLDNEHLYEVGDDIDFLRELDKPDLFGDEPVGS
jgi:anti-sigma factor RsiW